MGGFTIREATEADVEARVDLYIAVATEGRWIGGELPLDRAELIEQRRASARSDQWITWVAEADGAVIGDLGMHLHRNARGDIGMAIDEAWRGRGVGSALMTAAVEWARARPLDKLYLEVWPHNQAAIALYEKFGFAREGYHPMHYRRKTGEAWDAISMGLVLRR